MKKTLTVSIAAYNVEKYIEETLKSVLVNNIDDLEILVEDDGGTDNTANIVKEYEKKYPGIVKLVHKENGGYGSTINKSIELAQGKYFKQLDGDDWYDSKNFEKFLELLRTIDTDAVYTPYKTFYENKQIYIPKEYFSEDIVGEYDTDEVINKSSHSLEMYTMTYKTSILKKNKIQLLTNCLYTDKEYAMYPMMYSKTIYISHLFIYIYRYGREEQSVSIKSRRNHYQDQIKVIKRTLNIITKNLNNLTEGKKIYMFNYVGLESAAAVSSFLILLPTNSENLKKIKDFEKYIYDNNKDAYNEMLRISKIGRILTKTRYNYVVYKILSMVRIRKLTKRQK